MKSKLVWTFIATSLCGGFLISSADAGGRQSLGLSTGGASATGGGPIGGYVPPRTPLPPLPAPAVLNPNIGALVPPTSTSTSGKTQTREIVTATAVSTTERLNARKSNKISLSEKVDRAERKFVDPPPGGPPKVTVPPSVTGTGNIAGNNFADKAFRGSILDTGLTTLSKAKGSDQAPLAPTAKPPVVPQAVPGELAPMTAPAQQLLIKGASSAGSPGG